MLSEWHKLNVFSHQTGEHSGGTSIIWERIGIHVLRLSCCCFWASFSLSIDPPKPLKHFPTELLFIRGNLIACWKYSWHLLFSVTLLVWSVVPNHITSTYRYNYLWKMIIWLERGRKMQRVSNSLYITDVWIFLKHSFIKGGPVEYQLICNNIFR